MKVYIKTVIAKRKLREMGLTITYVANQIEISPSHFISVINAKRPASPFVRRKLQNIFNLSYNELFEEK